MVVPTSSVSFTLNDEKVQLKNVNPHLTLLEWLRAQPGLTGTKKMCGEGGCGCCVVSVTRKDPVTKKESTIAINSCLCPLYSVDGWTIQTVEGIGSSKKGFHPIQKAVAQYNGSQCGFCTPGFVMSMYSFLEENATPTSQEIEDNFDGHICRCTGYRPILDAMKSFAADSDAPVIVDIEDFDQKKKCLSCPLKRNDWNVAPCSDDSPVWYRPQKVSEIIEIFGISKDLKKKLVCGDTGRGVYKEIEDYDVFIDVKGVAELNRVMATSTFLSVGAAVSLNSLIQILLDNSKKSPTFQFLAEHIKKIANVPVRNIASWAGNLMLTHDHENFPSDMYTIMCAVSATVTIATEGGSAEYPLWDFLQQDMNNSILVYLNIPYSPVHTWFRPYKVMSRSQNAHAYVNAGLHMEVNPDSHKVQVIPSFIFGGIDEHPFSATATESFMLGKDVTDPDTLKGALKALSDEIEPNSIPVAASSQYRKNLALNLFYKFYLTVLGDKVDAKYSSAAKPYIRPISKGSQSFETDKSEYPLTQPIPKLTAALQASGEAQYTTDIPKLNGEVAAAFVLTTQANAKIIGMDQNDAMNVPGAVCIITSKDIPENGKNNLPYPQPEQIFATDVSEYAGQVVAIAVADTQEHANLMAKVVSIKYENLEKPILSLEDAIAASSFFPNSDSPVTIGDANDAISKSDHQISGEISCGTQYHFHMETHAAVAIPEDSGYTIYSSTQWVQLVQLAAAGVLGIPNNKVDVIVKRVGGGYGAKITRSCQTAAACALGAYVTGRPVRMHMELETNMKSTGKRFPYLAKYTIGSTKDGVLNGIKIDLYNDCGRSINDTSMGATLISIDNVYKCPNWLLTPYSCKTNTPSNTACRAPGYLPGIFIIESMMDHLAKSLKKDPDEIKEANMYKQGDVSYISDKEGMALKYCNIGDLWKRIIDTAEVETRKKDISDFNSVNRWRKRGMSIVPLKYGIGWATYNTTVLVSVYSDDGTVSIVHGGVEIGQGINTKVAQVAAKTLGISMNLIEIKPTNCLTNPNGTNTGGSITSELNCQAVLMACEALKERLEKVEEQMKNDGKSEPSWLEVIKKAFENGVDLSSKYHLYEKPIDHNFQYNSYGVTCAEVEVDVLTGQTEVLRADILYDCGNSMNPDIDVGQIEGAFVMGLGYWLTEKVVYDSDSGQLLTPNTWEYKPPASKDIPQDMRISLLQNAPNPLGILGSKAVGEPPQAMSNAVLFAVKRAIESARHDAGNDDLISLSAPATVENIQLLCKTNISQMLF